MRKGLSLAAVGHATSVLLALSFLLCVVFDLLFPKYAMYQAWQPLLPGFEGLDWKGVILGSIEIYAYGWYIALIWVPVYNVVSSRAGGKKAG